MRRNSRRGASAGPGITAEKVSDSPSALKKRSMEVHKFGINLSYKEPEDPPEAEFRNVVRYDCTHYHAEIHRFWRSKRPEELKWAKDLRLDGIFNRCREDIMKNYRSYIQRMRAASRSPKRRDVR